MNRRLTAVLHRLTAFVWPPTGEHRRTAVWPAAPDTVTVQAFKFCGPCGMELPVTLHGDAYLCPHGHVTGGDAS